MNKKTIAHILEIGCSGLIGVIMTIGYQHFNSTNPSFTFIYNGKEMIVTESSYTNIIEENKSLIIKLANSQDQVEQLEKQLNEQQDLIEKTQTELDERELQLNNRESLLNEREQQLNEKEEQINTQQIQIDEEQHINATPLVNLEYFTKKGGVNSGHTFDYTDNYDNTYPNCITPFDSGETFIEYYIDAKYTNLSGTLYITSHAKRINPEYYTWDIATFSVYGDDALLYSHTGFTTKDEPIPVNVDITGVKFLKIYFNDAHYYDEGMSESLIGFGDPMIN